MRNNDPLYNKHRRALNLNRKKIYATETTCAICGKPVDFTLTHPHPLSPSLDHIIPISKGGHPSDIDNLQLTHFCCNRQKYDSLYLVHGQAAKATLISPRHLPQSRDWSAYSSTDEKE